MNQTSADGWRCTVCGYVHRGSEPPETCPVCGAARDAFDPVAPAPAAEPASRIDRWRCLNCQYVHTGEAPPEVCPVCAAGADRFEPAATSRPRGSGKASGKASGKVLVVGGGAAGVAAVSYAFSGNVLFQYCNCVFLVGAAWLPLAVLAADRMLLGRSPRWAVILGLVLAMITLGGNAELAYHAGLLAALYALWLWWRGRAAGSLRKGEGQRESVPPSLPARKSGSAT